MFGKAFQTLVSLAKMLIRSKYFLPVFKTDNTEIIVIGNGPSARELLQTPPPAFRAKPLMAVNMMAMEPCFQELKPAFYLMADHAFFEFDEKSYQSPGMHPRVQSNPGYEQTQALVNKAWSAILAADWPMVLYVPQIYISTFPVSLARSKGIQIVEWNYTVVKGFTWFENISYRKGWGSPQCQNVINACIFQCINSGFKNVYLTGIDNNFHLNIIVEEDNTVSVVDNHFYEVRKKVTPLMSADKHGNPVKVKLHQFFTSLSKAFYSYQRLADYAKYRSVNIYNCTEGSFVDAFERKRLDQL